MNDEMRKEAERVRLYMMGDTGLGGEADDHPGLGLTRMSKSAMRRTAHLAEVQHQAARSAVQSLAARPDLTLDDLTEASEAACSHVMGLALAVSREAGLDARQEETYFDAARKGCDRLRVAVAETIAEGRGSEIRAAFDLIRSKTLDLERWHGIGSEF